MSKDTGWKDVIGSALDGYFDFRKAKAQANSPWAYGGQLGPGIPYPGNPNAVPGYAPADTVQAGFSMDKNTMLMVAALVAVVGVALVVAN